VKNKLEFRLVPVSGTLKDRGGYRAEFKKDSRNRVIDFDGVVREAINEHRWNVDHELVKLYFREILISMLKNTAKDGRVRRIDDFFSVSLNLHGRFDDKRDNFDPARHELRLVMRPLTAFRVLSPRPGRDVEPVNVDRTPQFRITSITAADGKHKNHQVVFGQDIVIRGTNMAIKPHTRDFISLNVVFYKGEIGSKGINEKVVSYGDREIRLAWPEDAGEESIRQRLVFSIWKANDDPKNKAEYIRREIYANILPA